MNNNLILRMLIEACNRAKGGHCGLDDDELMEVAKKLEPDCGLGDEEMRREVERFKALPPEEILRIAENFVDHKLYEESICRRYGITRATMYRWMQKGKLPKEFRHDGEGKKFLFASECDEAVEKYSNT